MAHHVEPMDIDSSVCDFDDKENAFHHNNVLPRTPCTEKGYEELDVSELNMKLRYSVTPAGSPMSKSYAGNCFDNSTHETDAKLDSDIGNMTRSLHTTLTKNDTITKSQKTLPLQALPTDLGQSNDGHRFVLQSLDATITVDKNIADTVSGCNDIDENLSLPSSSSSMSHTPEATTPTKEVPKSDGSSPIIRGLKSVLNMFRPSQSPIPGEDDVAKLETLSPPIVHSPVTSQDDKKEAVSSSTPLVGHRTKDPLTKRTSPHKESLVFNEDLETELEWKDDSTILFSHEKIPIHKLFFQQPKSSDATKSLELTKSINRDSQNQKQAEDLNSTVEYMDISYNDSGIMDKTATTTKLLSDLNKSEVANTESESEFQDCESTFTKNDSYKDDNILDSTEDVLLHINDLVEPKNTNASVETLNVSDTKSPNLSTASIETTKQNNSQHLNPEEKEPLQESYAEHRNEAIPTVSDNIIIDQNNHVTDLISNNVSDFKSISESKNDTVAVHSLISENVGVKSLSQIPLIIDPRVLLFNIPSVTDSEDVSENVADRNLNTLPADIPLPEDDDIPSLPVMNSELENLSQKLDHIAEEIPKINEHESSVSSIGSLSDIKSTESPVILSEERETFVSDNLETQLPILENTKSIDISVKVEADPYLAKQNSVLTETVPVETGLNEERRIPAVMSDIEASVERVALPSEIKEVEVFGLQGNISQNTEVPDTIPIANEVLEKTVPLTEIRAEIKNTVQPSEFKSDLVNTALPAHVVEDAKEIKTVLENATILERPAEIKSVEENTALSAEIKEGESTILPPEHDNIALPITLENTPLSTCTSENNEPVASPKETEALVKTCEQPDKILEYINSTIPVRSDTENVETAVASAAIPEKNCFPVPIFDGLNIENDNPFEIGKDIGVPISVPTDLPVHSLPKFKNVIPIDKSIVGNDIDVSVAESMDISITDIQDTADDNKTRAISEEVANVNAPICEFVGISKGLTDTKGHLAENNDNIDAPIQISNIVSQTDLPAKLSETPAAENNAQVVESNIEIIKQEVEAILTKAIDIAIEKANSNTNRIVTNIPEAYSKIEHKENIAIEKIAVSFENNVVEGHDQIKEKSLVNNNSNVLDPISLKDASIVISEAANVQQSSLNQMSDNKYSYTVQDNILAAVNHSADPADKEAIIPNDNTEKPIMSNDITIYANSFKNVSEEMDIDIQSEIVTNDDNKLDVTPSDIIKIERIKTADEEITVSENNSPFVSVSHELEDAVEVKLNPAANFDGIENPFVTKSKIVKTPPASPVIVSKGYNFNFDEIDDPFATKTKIRMSPAQELSPNQTFEQINVEKEPHNKDINKKFRRQSQPDRRRPANNKKMNSTFAGKSSRDTKPSVIEAKAVAPQASSVELNQNESTKETADESLCQVVTKKDITIETANISKSLDKTQDINDHITVKYESPAESMSTVPCEVKGTSSSEQSTYFSADTSSDEASKDKTEVKIPHFDDPNFNPFASKSKIRQSPPPESPINPFSTRSRICQTPSPDLDCENPFATKSKIRMSPETSLVISKDTEMPVVQSPNEVLTIEQKVENVEASAAEMTVHIETPDDNNAKLELPEEKDSAENISGATCSSNNDKESTVREVNTEDEDTVEGPFLEAEDLQNYDKMSDFGDNVDMMQFSELPPNNEDNPDAGELFIDAEAFEFLLNQNKANTITDSGKESLFLKFDPLFAKRVSSDGVMAALKQVQVKQSTPIKDKKPQVLRSSTFDKSPLKPSISRDATFDKTPLKPTITRDATFDKTPLAGPSGLNETQDMGFNSTAEESYDDLNVTVSKPMMVVNPAVNPVVTPRNKTITPVRSNRQSLTFTSPAIAVIDRLLSLSAANNSLMAHDTTVAEVRRDNEADLALTQLRELLADKEISVYNLRSETKELQNRLSTLESQMKSLEAISEERLKKINELNEKLNEKTKINKNMAKVVEEYERTIASLIAETEQDKKRHAEERLQLIRERDEQTAHLASMEVSFSDLHSKYEKSKQVIMGFKTNEDAYKKSIKEFEENLAKMQKNYELLKQHATSKLNHANEELQKINRAHEAEVLKMNAMIKRKELHITSLEETLQQKTKANEELTAICDELINKVG